jgi:acyl carrier protein
MQSLQACQTPICHMPWDRRVAEILAPISPSTGPDDMEAWIVARIAETMELDPLRIDPTLPPSAYGFDSSAAAVLTKELTRHLGRRLPENLFLEAGSVRGIARTVSAGAPRRNLPCLPTQEEMRRRVLARAARLPRCPSTDPGAGSCWGRVGCSPSECRLTGSRNLNRDIALAS